MESLRHVVFCVKMCIADDDHGKLVIIWHPLYAVLTFFVVVVLLIVEIIQQQRVAKILIWLNEDALKINPTCVIN